MSDTSYLAGERASVRGLQAQSAQRSPIAARDDAGRVVSGSVQTTRCVQLRIILVFATQALMSQICPYAAERTKERGAGATLPAAKQLLLKWFEPLVAAIECVQTPRAPLFSLAALGDGEIPC